MKNFIVFALLLLSSIGFTQPPDEDIPESKKEEIKAQKIAFMSNELNLSPDEAQKFWPVYNEYEAKVEALRKERRGYIKQLKENSLSPDEAYKVTESIFDSEIKEANLRKEYLAKFAEILGKEKAVQVFIAEEKFKKELLKKLRQDHKGHGGPPPPNH